MKFACYLFALAISLISCDDSENRPEKIEKLRPILVEVADISNSSNQVPEAGESLALDFHFLTPSPASEIVLEGEQANSGINRIHLGELGSFQTLSSTEYPGLTHVVHRVSFQLDANNVVFLSEGLARINYRLNVTSGERQFPIEGDFLIFSGEDVVGANWFLSQSEILQPTESFVTNTDTLDIKAEIANAHQEPIKISWFVSDGEIKNRRAASTEWKLPGPGEHTLVFTVRGKKSRNGTIRFVRVRYE